VSDVCARVLIEGRVQGVFFRQSTREMADRLELSGWVRNLPDGRVEALFAGPAERVRQAVDWCRQGPPAARVTNLELSWEEPATPSDGFRVRY